MPLVAGTRLGPYEIVAPIGAGGMGQVYRAHDSKLRRDVAVKVLPDFLARDPDALSRFEHEALAVAALSHPNILSIFDFGRHGGIAFSVTELLEGDTLRDRLNGGPISQRQAVDYARQIAKGLSAAHEKGIIHRDLKPENLFVSRDGHVKILDFGLAKRMGALAPAGDGTSVPTASPLTQPGALVGTVGYMSPEQVRALPVDHRSDIFAFGSILYELLSGKRAFRHDSAIDTLNAIIRDEPPELSGSGRGISPALDHIVRHCLEKDPDNRFQSAKDVAFALSEVSSPMTESGAALRAPEAGRRRVLIAVAAVVLLAVGGIVLLRRPHGGAREAGVKRLAVLPFENLGSSEDDYFADGIADEIRGKLISLPGLRVIARGSSTPYKKTTRTPKQIAEELDVDYLLTATVRWQKVGGSGRVHVSPELIDASGSGAPTSRWQQSFDAAITDVFQVQSDIASRVAQSLGGALGSGEEKRLSEKPTRNLAAYDAFLKGDDIFNAGASDLSSQRKALGFYERAVALDPGFAQAWARLSSINSLLYFNSTPAPALAERAREAGEKALALEPNRPEGHLALADYQRRISRDFTRALEQYEKALRLAPGETFALRGTAFTEQALGRWDAAVEHFEQAERLDPRSASNPRNLGDTLLRLRRYSEAREALDRGLALSPASLSLIKLKAMTYLGEGDLAGARAVLEAAPGGVEPTSLVAYLAHYDDLAWVLDEDQRELLLRLTPGAFDDDRGVWALCLAEAYALEGDASNVSAYAEETRKAVEEQLRAAPQSANRHAVLGLALAFLGRKEEAIREAERGVALEPNARDGPYYKRVLARVYILVGEPEKALDRLEPLLKVPYYLSPGWLEIDPSFDPLRNNPRFQRLVAGAR
jgi:TolB-like protein/Tfp pilus assembly protein PilF